MSSPSYKQNCFRTKQRTGNPQQGAQSTPFSCLSPRHLLLHCGVLSPPVLTLCLPSLEAWREHPPTQLWWLRVPPSPPSDIRQEKHPALRPLCTAVNPFPLLRNSKSIFTFLTSSAQDGFESIRPFIFHWAKYPFCPKVIGSNIGVSPSLRDEERSCLELFPTSTWVPKTAYASLHHHLDSLAHPRQPPPPVSVPSLGTGTSDTLENSTPA